MTDDEDIGTIIVENGSGSIKAGLAFHESEERRNIFPCVVGHVTKEWESYHINPSQKFYAGEALKYMESVDLHYPIEHGIITNWDDMELLWREILYYNLRFPPEEHYNLQIVSSLTSKGQKEKIAQIMFEKFNAPCLSVLTKDRLSRVVYSRSSGINLHCGDGVISVMPQYENRIISDAIKRIDFGGRDITLYLMRLLSERGYSLSTLREAEHARCIKETLCYAALDYEHELTSSIERKSYEIHSQTIKLGKERFQCVEALFKPSLIGSSSPGIHQLLHDSIMECDIDARKELYENIVLSGGSTLFPGFPERLKKEMDTLRVGSDPCVVNAYPERIYDIWVGGSIFAFYCTRDNLWTSKQNYDEFGPSIIHKDV